LWSALVFASGDGSTKAGMAATHSSHYTTAEYCIWWVERPARKEGTNGDNSHFLASSPVLHFRYPADVRCTGMMSSWNIGSWSAYIRAPPFHHCFKQAYIGFRYKPRRGVRGSQGGRNPPCTSGLQAFAKCLCLRLQLLQGERCCSKLLRHPHHAPTHPALSRPPHALQHHLLVHQL
jgi:hypothetical protein